MEKTSCLDIEQLARYQGGLGSARWRQNVDEHLRQCAVCRDELAALNGVADMLRVNPPGDAPDQWEAISAQLEPRRSRWWAGPVYAKVGMVAATAALAGVGLFAGLRFADLPDSKPDQTTVSAAQSAELAHSHLSLAWNDPFSDAASLAVMAARERTGETQ